jgi:lysophospholipase L1-like esterase
MPEKARVNMTGEALTDTSRRVDARSQPSVQQRTHGRAAWLIRGSLLFAGSGLIVVALLARSLGFGGASGVGIGQIIQISVGMLLVLAGLLGRAFGRFYQALAVVVLNTWILLALLELTAIATVRLKLVPSYVDVTMARYQELPYYREQDWTSEYWREARVAESYRYVAYAGWRHDPFEGAHISISADGIRRTPEADCSEGAYIVFTFGGSTMWGWGAPDWGTIPAYLQSGLADLTEAPVCVVNLGEDAYVSTQSLVTLMLQLQQGNVPDAVVFYDGVNDVYAAYESGQPGAHPMLADIAARFEDRESGWSRMLKSTRLYAVVRSIVYRPVYYELHEAHQAERGRSHLEHTGELATAVAERYVGNYDVVSRLSREYGFQVFFFWQPHLAVGEKVFTEEELAIRSELDPVLADMANAAYSEVELLAPEYDDLWYLADAFDDLGEQIWIDSWGHVTPVGNRHVAEAMLAIIEDQLERDQ